VAMSRSARRAWEDNFSAAAIRRGSAAVSDGDHRVFQLGLADTIALNAASVRAFARAVVDDDRRAMLATGRWQVWKHRPAS